MQAVCVLFAIEASRFSISGPEMMVHTVCVCLFSVNLIVRFAERGKLEALFHVGTMIDILTIASFII